MVAVDEIFGCASIATFESTQNVENSDDHGYGGQANQYDPVVDVGEAR